MKKSLLSDLSASLVVFLVALPLGLGIALASGAPSVVPGLIGCAIGGLVVGVLAGAPFQVSGPAAGLTVIMFNLIGELGWEVVCTITALAGLVQIVLGQAKLGKFCLGISPAVVHGMLAGIGVVIALSQIHVVLGGTAQSSAMKNIVELPGQLAALSRPATALGVATFLLISVWPLLPKVLRAVPGPLGAILLMTVIANIFDPNIPHVRLPESVVPELSLPTFPESLSSSFFVGIITVALVASVESLLCAVATDRLHSGPEADLDKELNAQGVGNFLSGLLGGLPVTGVIIRSTANIQAGATTRLSAILHGLWVVLFVLFAAPLLQSIPLAVLGGLLVHVGVSLVKWNHIKELYHHGEIVVYVVTLLGVTFLNLLEGVGLGLLVALAMLLVRAAKADIELHQHSATAWNLELRGVVSFLAVPRLRTTLSSIPQGTSVTLEIDTQLLDHAAKETLVNWRALHEERGGEVVEHLCRSASNQPQRA